MTGTRRVFWLALILLFGSALAAGAGDPETTVYLVRHAEKQAGPDPSLTEAGAERAETLARTLSDAGIQAVFSTQFARTRETAMPVAGRLGLEVTITRIETDLAEFTEAFSARLLKKHAGQSVLVVGHSNTVPVLIEALGVSDATALTDQDYDDLFVVTIDRAGAARVTHLHYGAASP